MAALSLVALWSRRSRGGEPPRETGRPRGAGGGCCEARDEPLFFPKRSRRGVDGALRLPPLRAAERPAAPGRARGRAVLRRGDGGANQNRLAPRSSSAARGRRWDLGPPSTTAPGTWAPRRLPAGVPATASREVLGRRVGDRLRTETDGARVFWRLPRPDGAPAAASRGSRSPPRTRSTSGTPSPGSRVPEAAAPCNLTRPAATSRAAAADARARPPPSAARPRGLRPRPRLGALQGVGPCGVPAPSLSPSHGTTLCRRSPSSYGPAGRWRWLDAPTQEPPRPCPAGLAEPPCGGTAPWPRPGGGHPAGPRGDAPRPPLSTLSSTHALRLRRCRGLRRRGQGRRGRRLLRQGSPPRPPACRRRATPPSAPLPPSRTRGRRAPSSPPTRPRSRRPSTPREAPRGRGAEAALVAVISDCTVLDRPVCPRRNAAPCAEGPSASRPGAPARRGPSPGSRLAAALAPRSACDAARARPPAVAPWRVRHHNGYAPSPRSRRAVPGSWGSAARCAGARRPGRVVDEAAELGVGEAAWTCASPRRTCHAGLPGGRP